MSVALLVKMTCKRRVKMIRFINKPRDGKEPKTLGSSSGSFGKAGSVRVRVLCLPSKFGFGSGSFGSSNCTVIMSYVTILSAQLH
jgi:hypothetical protein